MSEKHRPFIGSMISAHAEGLAASIKDFKRLAKEHPNLPQVPDLRYAIIVFPTGKMGNIECSFRSNSDPKELSYNLRALAYQMENDGVKYEKPETTKH